MYFKCNLNVCRTVVGFKTSKNTNPNAIILYFILVPLQHSIDEDDCFPDSNVAEQKPLSRRRLLHPTLSLVSILMSIGTT